METIEKAWKVVRTLVFITFGFLAYYCLFMGILPRVMDPNYIPEILLVLFVFMLPIHMLISIAIFVIVLPMLIYGIKNKELSKLRLTLLIAIFIYNGIALAWFIHWALFTDVI